MFMIGLLGVGMRIAAVAGVVLLVLMWSASLPPQDDIFIHGQSPHLCALLIGLALVAAGNTFGLGWWWTQTSLVRRFPWLT